MGIFDFIPTVPEIVSSTICVAFGHEYEPIYIKGKLAGYICSICEKVKP